MFKIIRWIVPIAFAVLACGGDLLPVAASTNDPGDPTEIGFYGFVLEGDTGQPLPGACVEIRCAMCQFYGVAYTDEKGHYSIPAGSHEGHNVGGAATWGKWGQGMFMEGCPPPPVRWDFNIFLRLPEVN